MLEGRKRPKRVSAILKFNSKSFNHFRPEIQQAGRITFAFLAIPAEKIYIKVKKLAQMCTQTLLIACKYMHKNIDLGIN